jgi:hypothetical protein
MGGGATQSWSAGIDHKPGKKCSEWLLRPTQLDEGDVEWAIEEYGVCETDEHTIIEVDG